MSVPDSVYELVEKFDSDKDRFISPHYNEAQLRQEFVNPFFAALGWEIGNSRQVLHEAGIRSGGTTKHPDYSFLAGHRRAFYVETKKPSVDILNAYEPAHQIRSYGWSGNTEIGILTNFKEFAVYDCRVEPTGDDPPGIARELYLTYEEYLENWEDNVGLFARESVLKRKHRRVLEDKPAGILRVDEAFLRQLESWRDVLAKHIFKQAQFLDITLDSRRLNELVTRTINRIVFLRIAEDRSLEDPGRLDSATRARSNIYSKIKSLFHAADKRYNSGLFHFDPKVVDRGEADELAMNIHINDDVISHIIQDLYPPKSLYQFSVISADILGQVYERFLGKVIEVTGPNDVSVEEKPEVRKAGGVYYTPDYIVDYIVENTVGKLLEGKTPEEVANLRILDPACGSGSFLVGAYQYLLDWHLDYYRKHSARYKNRILHTLDGIVLKTREKKCILKNNIYGVDLDPNAVEVSKLSLFLKMLEHENEATRREAETVGLSEQLLPDLGTNNIKCGNSLIESDFFDHFDMDAFDTDELHRINPFNWESREHGFGDIMADGGFDAVIGNPPWGYEFTQEELSYLRTLNMSIVVRMIDSFMYFVYQFTGKTKRDGYFGMIVPDVIAYQSHNKKLRNYLLKFAIRQILNMGDVFYKVTRPASIIIIQNIHLLDAVTVADLSQVPKLKKSQAIRTPNNYRTVSQAVFESLPGQIFVTSKVDDYSIWQKAISVDHHRLRDVVDHDGIQRGVSPDLKEAFIVSSKTRDTYSLEKSTLRPTITGGRHVKRYAIIRPDLWLIYTTRSDDFALIPNICKYIDIFASDITCKEVGTGKHPIYSLHRPRNANIFLKDRKLVGVITEDEIVIALDTYQSFPTDGIYLFGLSNRMNEYFIMGILNSKFMVFLYRLLALERGRVLAQVKPILLNELPIPTIDFDNSSDVAMHDQMVELVDRMLDLYKQLPQLTGIRQDTIQAQIERTDREIDQLVYKLYDLTPDEIAIVEGRGS